MKKRRSLLNSLHVAWIGGMFLFLYLPLSVLITFSFNSESYPSPWKSFSLKWYHELYQSIYLWNAFKTSLIIALSATTISILIGICLIFYASQGGRISKFLTLFYGNMVIPETVIAIGLLSFFVFSTIKLGLTTLIIAHSVLGIGFVIPITYLRYQEMDQNLTEASLTLGATPLQTFFKITIPFLRPSLIASALLVFILSFDDFILSYFCAGSTTQTLSLYILSSIRSGISPVLNALATVLLLLSITLALLFFSIRKRTRIF